MMLTSASLQQFWMVLSMSIREGGSNRLSRLISLMASIALAINASTFAEIGLFTTVLPLPKRHHAVAKSIGQYHAKAKGRSCPGGTKGLRARVPLATSLIQASAPANAITAVRWQAMQRGGSGGSSRPVSATERPQSQQRYSISIAFPQCHLRLFAGSKLAVGSLMG